MKLQTYIFTWADGHISYESFRSQRELDEYLLRSKHESCPLIMYEPEDGVGF